MRVAGAAFAQPVATPTWVGDRGRRRRRPARVERERAFPEPAKREDRKLRAAGPSQSCSSSFNEEEEIGIRGKEDEVEN